LAAKGKGSMADAFLTGVGLESCLGGEEEEDLATEPLVPCKRPLHEPRNLCLQDLGASKIWVFDAIEDSRPPPDVRSLLKEADRLGGGDPLDELRRRIRRTRAKMDSQTKVLDGFISDVQQIKSLQRGFSCSDLATCSAASCGGGAATAGRHRRSPEPPALLGPPLCGSRRPSSAGGAARSLAMRGGCSAAGRLSEKTRSQPTLLDLHQRSALAVPKRRAPPGGAAVAESRVSAAHSNLQQPSRKLRPLGRAAGRAGA